MENENYLIHKPSLKLPRIPQILRNRPDRATSKHQLEPIEGNDSLRFERYLRENEELLIIPVHAKELHYMKIRYLDEAWQYSIGTGWKTRKDRYRSQIQQDWTDFPPKEGTKRSLNSYTVGSDTHSNIVWEGSSHMLGSIITDTDSATIKVIITDKFSDDIQLFVREMPSIESP